MQRRMRAGRHVLPLVSCFRALLFVGLLLNGQKGEEE